MERARLRKAVWLYVILQRKLTDGMGSILHGSILLLRIRFPYIFSDWRFSHAYLQNTNPDGRIKGLRFEDKDGNEVFPTVRIEGRRIVMDSEENLALRCVRAKYCMGRKAEKYGSLCTDEGYTVIPFNIYV